jgi:hypothetical protein
VLVAASILAFVGAERTRAPYAVLLGGIALLGAWMLVWVKILGGAPSPSTLRWLLLSGGAALTAAGATLAAARARGARELTTAGGIGAVAAGVTGVLVGAFGVTVDALGALGSSQSSSATVRGVGGGVPLHLVRSHITGEQTFGWDLVLLVVSVGLLWIASSTRNRGAGYAGGVGLLAFLASVGSQLTRLEAGHHASRSLAGWPLALVLVGLAGLFASSLRRLAR